MLKPLLAQYPHGLRKRPQFLGMKLMLLFLVVFMQIHAEGIGQSKITLSFKNVSLETVLREITRQSGFDYSYATDISKANKIDISVKEASLSEALNICFKNQPFTYTIVKNTIVINDKPQQPIVAVVLSPIDIITGKIISDKGDPVQGAAVFVKGTGKGTTTDDDGTFALKGVSEDAVLSITSVGFYDTTIQVNGRKAIFVKVRVKLAELGQAVVSVSTGYQQIPKERATGSFAFVDNQLFNRRVSTDVLSRLEGVVPGLLFNRNTSDNEISIRGRSTLFANASPLIVVDNFPYDGDINNINPNDIESVTVLKDAAAASIWGVQSGNGVIVITTKRGKRNQPLSVEINANTTVINKPNIYYSKNFLSSKDFIEVERNLFNQGYYDAQLTDATQPPVSPVVQILSDLRNGLITQQKADDQINVYKGIDIRNDLSKYFYRKAISQQYAINLRGGSDKTTYIFSVGYDKNNSNLIGDRNERFTLMGNSDFYLLKNLTFSAGFNSIQTSSAINSPVGNIITGGQYQTIYPYAQLADGNGNALAVVKDYNYSWITNPNTQSGLLNWQYKPLEELKYADNKSHLLDNKLNFQLKYNFIPDIKISILYQYESSESNSQNYYSDSTYYARNLINQFTDFSQSNPQYTTYPIPIGGIFQQQTSSLKSQRLRSQLELNHYIKSNNLVTAIIGAEVSEAVMTNNNGAIVYGYDKNNGSYQNVDYIDYYTVQPTLNYLQVPSGLYFYKVNNRYISYYSNVGYTFENKYTITASGRIDKSNLFGVKTNQKSVPLFSTGLSWRLSKENFYHIQWMPLLNLRATFGYNGNVDKGASAITTFDVLSNNYFFGLPFGQISYPGNPQLRWERTRMINMGFDYSILKDKISGSFEYYVKKGTDLFSNAPLPPSSGWSAFYGNNADIVGKGYDVILNIKGVTSKNLNWTVNLLSSFSMDKVSNYKSLGNIAGFLVAGASSGTISPQSGRPIFSIYAYRFEGLTHETGDPQGLLNGKLSTDYSSIIKAASIDSLHYIGSARPLYYGSIRNTISYKALSLSFNLIYKLKYYFKRSTISYSSLFRNWSGNIDFDKRWQKPGDEQTTIIPSMPTDINNLDENRDVFFYNSDALVSKGDHIRLQDITLSYEFKIGKTLGPSDRNIKVYAYVNNIGIIWRANHEHLDPDVYSTGTPSPRSISIGASLRF